MKEKLIEFSKALVLGITVLTVLLLILQPPPVKRLLEANHLLPEPEPLTELYFENHTQLPKTFVPGVPVGFRYTVHNIEYKDMKYDVAITQKTADGREKPVENGVIRLQHDGYKTLDGTATISEATRTAVMISLNTGQKIQLWVNPQN